MSRASSINTSFYSADSYGGINSHNRCRSGNDGSSPLNSCAPSSLAPYKYSPPSKKIASLHCSDEDHSCSTTDDIDGQKPLESIEVSPGHHLRFRGLKETFQAIQRDAYIPVSCMCCATETLFCIDDASFVLCSICRTISPTDQTALLDGGVGIGFTFEDLGEWQR